MVCVRTRLTLLRVHNLILLNRDELVGEKDFAHHAQFYHMICLCLVFQYYGVIIQPLSWSDSWIPSASPPTSRSSSCGKWCMAGSVRRRSWARRWKSTCRYASARARL